MDRVNPGESHPEQREHGSSRESRGERCEDRKGFPRWGKSLSFVGTYPCPCFTTFVSSKKIKGNSRPLALLAAFFLLTTISFAQNKLTINGKVSSEKGDPLSGVKVEVFETQIKTTTGPDGSFSITGLNPGEYRILFIHPDYMPGVLEITVSKDKKNHVQDYYH